MFKINDRVKVKIAEGVEQCGKVIEKGEENGMILFQNGSHNWFPLEDLSLITDPMDCLMVGDIIENNCGQLRKILGVNGKMYFVSNDADYNTASFGKTLFEIKNMSYTFCYEDPKIQEALDLLEKEGKIVDGKIIK